MVVRKIANTNGDLAAAPSGAIPVAAQKRMILSAIRETAPDSPEKIILYGPEGIGKSTWAAQAERPIFISTEDGLKGVRPTPSAFPEAETWQDILDAIETLRLEPHNYKTFVCDTADWADSLGQAHIMKKEGVVSIEKVGGGFGKGYVVVAEAWRVLLHALGKLRKERNMNIIFLGHSAIETFNNPAGDNYDRWKMKIDKRVYAMLKEWADALLMANYDVVVNTEKNQTKGKAFGGEKVIYAVHSPAWDAKNRYGITEPITLENSPFWDFVQKSKGGK